MSKPGGLVGQLARPHGVFAGPMAALMNWANKKQNLAVVEALEPRSSDRILEVGFGGGIALRRVLAGTAKTVAGLDLSEEVVARARRIFSKQVLDGRLRLERGSADELPFPDRSFDAVYSVNCIYFWPEPIRGLEEILRVLDNDGRIVLGLDPRSEKMFKARFQGYFDAGRTQDALRNVGFADVSGRESRPNHWIVSARRA